MALLIITDDRTMQYIFVYQLMTFYDSKTKPWIHLAEENFRLSQMKM